MDQIIVTTDHDDHQIMSQIQKVHQQLVHVLLIKKLLCFLGIRTTLQFLLVASFSLVSILLAIFLCCYRYYSSGHLPLFPDNDFFYFSTVIFSLFTHALERKYMFLLCNGILAFLAKSLRLSSSSTSDPDPVVVDMKALPATDGIIELPEAVGVAVSAEEEEDNAAAIVADEEGEREREEKEEEGDDGADDRDMAGDSSFLEAAHEGGSEALVTEFDDDDGVEGDYCLEDEEAAAAATEGVTMANGTSSEELMSTDELNKKIEEFIRKMKEEIRIEAQSQLIAV
ncbi:uncharacterized protein LOC116206795 [Punica granatum]|uniref:Uncharacterized protein n=2 Tax=Punica granatum TaxID=22663 RepID=A0A218XMX2_PUNGR|nr:uncharacterized protein LOC116206795 [Punica granatum]OWM85642.1 hypothetical protein CDL15_Pgr029065 [Punica granatum]PKI60763.1 hypothetical protein CRG98_018846 [Punica granatum]